MTNDIDRKIAEKVMKWEYSRNFRCYVYQDEELVFNKTNWHPTTNIEQAMMVVKRMVELGWCPEMQYHFDSKKYLFLFRWHEQPYQQASPVFGHSDESLTVAICEAALNTLDR